MYSKLHRPEKMSWECQLMQAVVLNWLITWIRNLVVENSFFRKITDSVPLTVSNTKNRQQ